MADYAVFLKHIGEKEKARKYDDKVKELGGKHGVKGLFNSKPKLI